MRKRLIENRVEQILLEHFLFGLFEISIEPRYILGIYKYGSRMYGMDTEESDLDYCIVIDNEAPLFPSKPSSELKEYSQLETKSMDLHIMSKRYYEELLEKHDIMALECYYQEDPIERCEVDFTLNLQALRKSISSTVSNSWVKASKKIQIEEEDSKIGLKSLYHSFRILDFGIQIAKYNDIIDYEYSGGLNPVRDSNIENIINPSWDFWNNKLKPLHNAKMTEFRLLAPKEKD